MWLIQKIENSALILAQAAKGNPVVTTITVILYMFVFNLFEASIEAMVFGDRFSHWLDPMFTAAFIAYGAYSVWACAVYNTK